MLQLKLTLIQNELDHNTGNQGQGNSRHEYEIVSTRSLFNVDELLIDRERLVYHIVGEVRVASGHTKNCLSDELREHCCRFLGGHVQVVDDLVNMALLVGLIDLV